MNPVAKELWIGALTDGSHKQVCGFMKKNPPGNTGIKNMCVMGVLADVALKYSGLEYTKENWYEFANSTWPTERTLKWAELSKEQARKLVQFNDAEKKNRKTFAEFAEYIKENF